MPRLFSHPGIWLTSGLLLVAAAALPLARPWRVAAMPNDPAPHARSAAPAAAALPPPPAGELARSLARVLGGPPPPKAAPPAAGVNLVLEGTVVEPGQSRALVRAPGAPRIRVLSVGQTLNGWTLKAVADGQATLTAGGRRVQLQTPRRVRHERLQSRGGRALP